MWIWGSSQDKVLRWPVRCPGWVIGGRLAFLTPAGRREVLSTVSAQPMQSTERRRRSRLAGFTHWLAKFLEPVLGEVAFPFRQKLSLGTL